MRYIGIDISKATFMVAFPKEKGFRTKSFTNNSAGIRSFIKELTPGEDHCVMEATGNYGTNAFYLLDKEGIAVSVINPRQSKNFARTLKIETKTDKGDACLLAEFGRTFKPQASRMPEKTIFLLKQKRTVLRQLRRQHSATSNVKHSLEALPFKDKSSINALDDILARLEKQMDRLEKEIANLSTEEFKSQMERLQTIKGIGATLAASLIIATGGFTYFDNAKQVSRYFGLCPTYQQSGTSIHVNGQISRSGDSYVRGQLYMAAMSAIRYNKACKECFERLKSNGKNGKLAMIAVCNKLIRQAFAVIKNDTPYIDGFVSEPPK